MRRLPRSLCAPAWSPAPLTAIRAGRLLDPEAGRDPHQSDHPRRGQRDPRRRTERRDSGRRAGDRSVADDGAARPRRRAQPSRAHLQAGAGEQRLLLHLRAGIDGAARDPGGVERHPDARLGLHHRPRHGQQRATTPTRRCGRRSSRAGFPDRRSSTPGSSSAAWAASSSRRPRWRRTTTSSIPEYLDADTPDEIVKAIRQNILFGAQGDQDLRRLQAVRLHGRRDPARHPRGGEGRDEGRGPRADASTARGTRSKPGIWSIAHSTAPQRRDAQADGAEGHLARRHRDADRARRSSGVAAGLPADRRRPEERVRQQGAADVLDRRRLLGRRARRAAKCASSSSRRGRTPASRTPTSCAR